MCRFWVIECKSHKLGIKDDKGGNLFERFRPYESAAAVPANDNAVCANDNAV